MGAPRLRVCPCVDSHGRAATTNLPYGTAYHVPPPWTGWPSRGCYWDGRGSRYKSDSLNLAPERLLLSEGLIHPSRANHDNTKTNKTESLLQPAAVGAAPPRSCGHRKPGRGKETRWETSCGSRGDRVKQNYPDLTVRGKAGEVHSNPSSTRPPRPLHLTLQIASLIHVLLGVWGTSEGCKRGREGRSPTRHMGPSNCPAGGGTGCATKPRARQGQGCSALLGRHRPPARSRVGALLPRPTCACVHP